jgi:hypothetical protein
MSSEKPRKVRVTVTVSLTVDAEAWNLEYGEGATAAEVRDSVKRYIGNEQYGIHFESGTWSDITWK